MQQRRHRRRRSRRQVRRVVIVQIHNSFDVSWLTFAYSCVFNPYCENFIVFLDKHGSFGVRVALAFACSTEAGKDDDDDDDGVLRI